MLPVCLIFSSPISFPTIVLRDSVSAFSVQRDCNTSVQFMSTISDATFIFLRLLLWDWDVR